MFRAGNGFTLLNEDTGHGWTIKSGEDVITALENYPVFQTVHPAFIVEALRQAFDDRKQYDDIDDLARFLCENYI